MHHPKMIRVLSSRFPQAVQRRTGAIALATLLGLSSMATPTGVSAAATPLADQPVFATVDVPGNLALALSVEFPTAISVSNLYDYADASTYLGYFDPVKCYDYKYNSTTPSSSFFQPAKFAGGTNSHSCSGQWSGNFMNWATMQTIDPFRWALTGGYRSKDDTTQTILEKAWGAKQGAQSNFPLRGTDAGTGHNLLSSLVSSVTPFSWSGFNTSIWSRGNTMVFAGTGTGYSDLNQTPSDLTDISSAKNDTIYQVYVRVRVCDASTGLGVKGLEGNCVQYSTDNSNYKPEGLLQQYSNKIRFSTFSYLNGLGSTRQGGVLREPMGFIGPSYPVPLSSKLITNTGRAEWDANGIMINNPDPTTAAASGVSQSGVMNYLNKFGETSQTYMTYDNVGELYYAAVRYFENLGNVHEWTDSASATEYDGFPAVATWKDPISYYCQKNFILGIGDDHTWYDYNVGGATATGSRAKPAAVASDTLNKTETWTANLQALEGITQTPWWASGAGSTTYYIAGLAYGTHVNDIRPDLGVKDANGVKTISTISTYWMDVGEYQRYENLNPYYLAAKYGGFNVQGVTNPPQPYTTNNVKVPLDPSVWNTNGGKVNMNGTWQPLPDNYFPAGSAAAMVSGLSSAFANIANAITAYTTSFSFSTAAVSSSGATSFAAQYNSTNWTGTINANTQSFASDGTPTSKTLLWTSDTTLQAQLKGSGWDTGRNVATWNGKGVPFRAGNLSSGQLTALTPSYSASPTCSSSTCPYLDYLRGDQFNEVGSKLTRSGQTSTLSLRPRTLLLGDIVDAQLTPVATPNMSYADTTNPNYSAFKKDWSSRPTMVYTGANDGMMHAFVGSSGAEQFAYIPSALYQGPNGTPQVDGLAQLGNPKYAHHFYVDATPLAFDLDFANTVGGAATSTDKTWHTLLIGGLGKGGKSYYAIDVTDPASMSTESAVAGNVLWEFTDPTMGYSYGAPNVVKTVKYGWVVVLTSGYNNSDGIGYLYLVDPSNGKLIQKIATPSGSLGLTQASAYVHDYTDYTADAVYVGDLNGQMWRFDLVGSYAYLAPTLLATVADSSGVAQPITSVPLIEIYPTSRKRFVMFGTGRLLASSDVSSSQVQSYYAILDGTAGTGSFNTVSTPITRTDLLQVTDLIAGISLLPTSKGWFTDLGTDVTSGFGWRVTTNSVTYNGIVSFTSLLTSGDACNPSGQSRVYVVNYSSGKSVLPATYVAGYEGFNSAVNDAKIMKVGSNVELIVGTTAGDVVKVGPNLTGTASSRLLNWREVPTAE